MKPRRRSRRSGNAAIEFALTFGVLFPLFAGAFQFGYIYYLYNELVTAVRGAARNGSMATYESTTETPTAAFVTAIKNQVVYGDPSGGTTPVVPRLTTDNVVVSVAFASGVPSSLTVAITNYQIDAVFTRLTLNHPRLVFAYTGRYAPP